MERRFETIFDAMMDGKTRGASFSELIRCSSNDDLVAALAAAGGRDSVAANAIATELLNRLHRAPFLGAFLVSVTTIVALYLLDYLFTGTFLLLESGARAQILVAISFTIALLSFFLFAMWRGRFRRLRMRARMRLDDLRHRRTP